MMVITVQKRAYNSTNENAMSYSCWRTLLLLLASSGTIKSYSIVPPFVDVPMIVTNAEIRSAEATNTNRVAYDAGIGKNKPVISQLQGMDNDNMQATSGSPFAFLVDHEAVNEIVPEALWRARFQRDNVQTEVKTKPRVLPSVVLNRFTDDDEIFLDNDVQTVDMIRASAKTNIRRNYDLNTPWIEMLIHNEKQKRLAKIDTTMTPNLVGAL
jgi:hypothetical protein